MSEQVREMFGTIAPTYDRVNAVLSLGIHHRWRRVAVRVSEAKPGDRVLDCATGTGDLALAFARVVGPEGRVHGADFSVPMLLSAPAKARQAGVAVEFLAADAQRLPYPEGVFDLASIAFGIRNVDDPVACLREMARVVRPGGKVAVLEFGQPRGVFGTLFRWYSRTVMPVVGGWLSGSRPAYEYLPRTSASFPAGDGFLALMSEAGGFARCQARALTSGVAWLYVGTVTR